MKDYEFSAELKKMVLNYEGKARAQKNLIVNPDDYSEPAHRLYKAYSEMADELETLRKLYVKEFMK